MASNFPKWTNHIPVAVALAAPVGLIAVVFFFWYWASPSYTDVGYQPAQPVSFSHKLHAGDLGMDCRYCHTTVEKAAMAAIPSTSVCMNCHKNIRPDSALLAPIRTAFQSGDPVEWTRVHMLPDYAYFDHSAHLAAGVGCVSCHGRIDQMETVHQDQSLSMGWCLSCHRDPNPNLRPLDKITQMDYDPHAEGYDPQSDSDRKRNPNPPEHCSGCHR